MLLHCGQGNGTGDAADKYWSAAETTNTTSTNEPATGDGTGSSERLSTPTEAGSSPKSSSTAGQQIHPSIHRSESYRHIIDQEDENASFFNRFRPSMKFVNIERIPRSKGVKL